MDVFSKCSDINDLLEEGNESEARDLLISVLDYHLRQNLEYSECLNHLIRETGLYPYLHVETASWQDRFVFEAFKVDSGEFESLTLGHLVDYFPQPRRGCIAVRAQGFNPVGVGFPFPGSPRVARASQPWAGCLSPVGANEP
jgi:hypothetical protein